MADDEEEDLEALRNALLASLQQKKNEKAEAAAATVGPRREDEEDIIELRAAALQTKKPFEATPQGPFGGPRLTRGHHGVRQPGFRGQHFGRGMPRHMSQPPFGGRGMAPANTNLIVIQTVPLDGDPPAQEKPNQRQPQQQRGKPSNRGSSNMAKLLLLRPQDKWAGTDSDNAPPTPPKATKGKFSRFESSDSESDSDSDGMKSDFSDNEGSCRVYSHSEDGGEGDSDCRLSAQNSAAEKEGEDSDAKSPGNSSPAASRSPSRSRSASPASNRSPSPISRSSPGGGKKSRSPSPVKSCASSSSRPSSRQSSVPSSAASVSRASSKGGSSPVVSRASSVSSSPSRSKLLSRSRSRSRSPTPALPPKDMSSHSLSSRSASPPPQVRASASSSTLTAKPVEDRRRGLPRDRSRSPYSDPGRAGRNPRPRDRDFDPRRSNQRESRRSSRSPLRRDACNRFHAEKENRSHSGITQGRGGVSDRYRDRHGNKYSDDRYRQDRYRETKSTLSEKERSRTEERRRKFARSDIDDGKKSSVISIKKPQSECNHPRNNDSNHKQQTPPTESETDLTDTSDEDVAKQQTASLSDDEEDDSDAAPWRDKTASERDQHDIETARRKMLKTARQRERERDRPAPSRDRDRDPRRPSHVSQRHRDDRGVRHKPYARNSEFTESSTASSAGKSGSPSRKFLKSASLERSPSPVVRSVLSVVRPSKSAPSTTDTGATDRGSGDKTHGNVPVVKSARVKAEDLSINVEAKTGRSVKGQKMAAAVVSDDDSEDEAEDDDDNDTEEEEEEEDARVIIRRLKHQQGAGDAEAEQQQQQSKSKSKASAKKHGSHHKPEKNKETQRTSPTIKITFNRDAVVGGGLEKKPVLSRLSVHQRLGLPVKPSMVAATAPTDKNPEMTTTTTSRTSTKKKKESRKRKIRVEEEDSVRSTATGPLDLRAKLKQHKQEQILVVDTSGTASRHARTGARAAGADVSQKRAAFRNDDRPPPPLPPPPPPPPPQVRDKVVRRVEAERETGSGERSSARKRIRLNRGPTRRDAASGKDIITEVGFEDELDHKINVIQRKNAEILRRKELVEAEKEKFG